MIPHKLVSRTALVSLALLLHCRYASGARPLILESFTLRGVEGDQGALQAGGEFDVGLKVRNHGVGKITYVLRTAEPIALTNAPPALNHYNTERQLAFLAHNSSVQLQDNSPIDLSPERDSFMVRLTTQGWEPGFYPLKLFAHNSTDRKCGSYEAVSASFAIEIEERGFKLHDWTRPSRTRVQEAGFKPATIKPGDSTKLVVAVDSDDLLSVRIVTPFPVAPENSFPDFTYNPVAKKSVLADPGRERVYPNGVLDLDPAPERMEMAINSPGVAPGLYFFKIEVVLRSGKPITRFVALKITNPDDLLEVEVAKPWVARQGSSSGRFTRLADGRLVYGGRISADQGGTWEKQRGGSIKGGCPELSSGNLIALPYVQLPIEGETGWYSSTLRAKEFASDRVTTNAARFFVPRAKAAMGHSFHRGPLCTGSFTELGDGTLIALMMGWFQGDDTLCPHGRGRPYSRSYVCASDDRGITWNYLATVGYDFVGSEGYNEGTIQRLADGQLIAVVRTGNMRDMACQDNPVMVTRSADGGRTWMKPWRTGVNGCYPCVALLSDNMLVISSGRPGAYLLFSSDNGDTWHDLTLVDADESSGYTAVIEVEPGKLLVAFGEGYIRHDIENVVKMTHVHYKRRR